MPIPPVLCALLAATTGLILVAYIKKARQVTRLEVEWKQLKETTKTAGIPSKEPENPLPPPAHPIELEVQLEILKLENEKYKELLAASEERNKSSQKVFQQTAQEMKKLNQRTMTELLETFSGTFEAKLLGMEERTAALIAGLNRVNGLHEPLLKCMQEIKEAQLPEGTPIHFDLSWSPASKP